MSILLTVSPAHALLGSSTVVVSSANPSDHGQSVTFTATVTGLVITPTGTVTFKAGGITIGTGTLNGSGQATFTTSALSAGSHSITAEYGGDLIYDPSNSTVLTQNVNKSASSTAVISSLNPSANGQTVTFTATVTGSGATPTGTVTFKDGAAMLGTGTLNGSGQATLTTSALTVGAHSITAEYGGDTNYNASTSPALTQNVNANASSTAVVSSVNPSTVGQSVTFTATVTGSSPTGNVTFKDGSTTLAIVALSGGQAAYTTSALTAGNHSITAEYGGDGSNGASTSSPLVQSVGTISTSVTVASSANPSPLGQTVTFTATVSGTGGTPSGTVTFKDGATTLGTGALNGVGQAIFATGALAKGSHAITAVYSGDSTFSAGTSAVLTQVVGAPLDSVRLRSLQSAASKVAAQGSGAATAGAIESAIAEAFDDSEILIRQNGAGVRANLAAEPQVTGSVRPGKAPRVAKEWLPWFDVRATGWDVSRAGTNLHGGQINTLAGLTRKLSPDLLVGILAGLEALDYRSTALNGRFSGHGWTAGAYLGWRPVNGLRTTFGAAYTRLLYDGLAGTAAGVIRADRITLTGGLSGTYSVIEHRLAFEPSLRGFAIWESQDAYTDTLGTAQDTNRFAAGRASAGGRLMYTWKRDDRMLLSPYVGAYADYYFNHDSGAASGSDPLVHGSSARLVGGVTLALKSGVRASLGGELGGIGNGDFMTWSARGHATVPF